MKHCNKFGDFCEKKIRVNLPPERAIRYSQQLMVKGFVADPVTFSWHYRLCTVFSWLYYNYPVNWA